MAIKLIAIDMDGTLLNPQHQITSRVKAAIAAARDKGVAVVLATGRPFVGIQRHLDELGLVQEGQYCVTYNGALVQKADTGECVAETPVSFTDYLYYEQLSRELGVKFQALTHSHMYTANKDISRFTIHEVGLTGMPLRYRAVDEMDTSLVFPKVMMIDEPEILDAAIARLPPEVHERNTLLKSAPFFLEILHKSVNKGTGVKLLSERLGIQPEEVMALGDQENDLAMIEFAGTGVAMGNAIDSLKAAAQFVTKSNQDDGVAYAIEKFVL